MVEPAGAAATAAEIVAKLGTLALQDPTAKARAISGCTASKGIAVTNISLRRSIGNSLWRETHQVDGTPHLGNRIGYRWDELNRDASARGSHSWPNKTDITNDVLLKQREHRGGGFARHHCPQQYQMTSKLSITSCVQIS